MLINLKSDIIELLEHSVQSGLIFGEDLCYIYFAPDPTYLELKMFWSCRWTSAPESNGYSTFCGSISLSGWLDEMDKAEKDGFAGRPVAGVVRPFCNMLQFPDSRKQLSFALLLSQFYENLEQTLLELASSELCRILKPGVGIFLGQPGEGNPGFLISFVHSRSGPIFSALDESSKPIWVMYSQAAFCLVSEPQNERSLCRIREFPLSHIESVQMRSISNFDWECKFRTKELYSFAFTNRRHLASGEYGRDRTEMKEFRSFREGLNNLFLEKSISQISRSFFYGTPTLNLKSPTYKLPYEFNWYCKLKSYESPTLTETLNLLRKSDPESALEQVYMYGADYVLQFQSGEWALANLEGSFGPIVSERTELLACGSKFIASFSSKNREISIWQRALQLQMTKVGSIVIPENYGNELGNVNVESILWVGSKLALLTKDFVLIVKVDESGRAESEHLIRCLEMLQPFDLMSGTHQSERGLSKLIVKSGFNFWILEISGSSPLLEASLSCEDVLDFQPSRNCIADYDGNVFWLSFLDRGVFASVEPKARRIEMGRFIDFEVESFSPTIFLVDTTKNIENLIVVGEIMNDFSPDSKVPMKILKGIKKRHEIESDLWDQIQQILRVALNLKFGEESILSTVKSVQLGGIRVIWEGNSLCILFLPQASLLSLCRIEPIAAIEIEMSDLIPDFYQRKWEEFIQLTLDNHVSSDFVNRVIDVLLEVPKIKKRLSGKIYCFEQSIRLQNKLFLCKSFECEGAFNPARTKARSVILEAPKKILLQEDAYLQRDYLLSRLKFDRRLRKATLELTEKGYFFPFTLIRDSSELFSPEDLANSLLGAENELWERQRSDVGHRRGWAEDDEVDDTKGEGEGESDHDEISNHRSELILCLAKVLNCTGVTQRLEQLTRDSDMRASASALLVLRRFDSPRLVQCLTNLFLNEDTDFGEDEVPKIAVRILSRMSRNNLESVRESLVKVIHETQISKENEEWLAECVLALYKLGLEKFPDRILDHVLDDRNDEEGDFFNRQLGGKEFYEEPKLLKVYRSIWARAVQKRYAEIQEEMARLGHSQKTLFMDSKMELEKSELGWERFFRTLQATFEINSNEFSSNWDGLLLLMADRLRSPDQFANDRLVGLGLLRYFLASGHKDTLVLSESLLNFDDRSAMGIDDMDSKEFRRLKTACKIEKCWSLFKSGALGEAKSLAEEVVWRNGSYQGLILLGHIIWTESGDALKVVHFVRQSLKSVKNLEFDIQAKLFSLVASALESTSKNQEALDFAVKAFECNRLPEYMRQISILFERLNRLYEAEFWRNMALEAGFVETEEIDRASGVKIA